MVITYHTDASGSYCMASGTVRGKLLIVEAATAEDAKHDFIAEYNERMMA